MYVEFGESSTAIYIKSDSVYVNSINYFIGNAFKQVVEQGNEKVIQATKEELVKKTYLVKWVLRTAQQKLSITLQHDFSKRIQKLPLHVVTLSQNVVLQKVVFSLQVLKDKRLVFLMDRRNRRMLKALKVYFGNYCLGTVKLRQGVVIDIATRNAFELLRKLLMQTHLNDIPINFIYSKEELRKLLESDSEKEKLYKAYQTLNLSPNCEMAAVTLRYKKLSRAYHPDRVYGLGETAIQRYTRKFQEIQEAFAYINEVRQSI